MSFRQIVPGDSILAITPAVGCPGRSYNDRVSTSTRDLCYAEASQTFHALGRRATSFIAVAKFAIL